MLVIIYLDGKKDEGKKYFIEERYRRTVFIPFLYEINIPFINSFFISCTYIDDVLSVKMLDGYVMIRF